MPDNGFGPVRTAKFARTLVITLDRPEARNAINADAAAGLEAAIDLLERDDELWVGVLVGAGSVFCAGADLKAVADRGVSELITVRGGFAGFVQRARTKPVIAALNGHAVAGGMEIAIAADIIIAAEGTHLGLPEATRSLLAVGGALANLPRLIGQKAALELAMTGELWPAERFVQLGLISKVVPAGTVLHEARNVADSLCRNAPLAVRASRRVIVDGADLVNSARWDLAERELRQLSMTSDFHEGPRAFLERRPPVWLAN